MKKEPTKRSDGTCSSCIGGNLCQYHREQGALRDKEISSLLQKLGKSIASHKIDRLISDLQLESDEGGTATEKAKKILGM